MRKLGIIGGMSWISTRAYYERINKIVQKKAPPMASPPMLIESLDYAPIAAAKNADDWDSIASTLVESARRLEAGGAEGLVMAANTMHKVYDRLTEAVSIPVLHIADCVGKAMEEDDCKNAALLGTRFVMTWICSRPIRVMSNSSTGSFTRNSCSAGSHAMPNARSRPSLR